jgi:uncharacterized membrane-anchored protein
MHGADVRVCRFLASLALLAVLAIPSPAAPQSQMTQDQVLSEMAALQWQRGPTEARIGTVATIRVPKGVMFLDSVGTRRFLELTGNPPRDNRYTLAADDVSWFSVFIFDPSGYVKDDEKLDPAALLKTLQNGDSRQNDERRRLGMTELYTDGWHVAPHYDTQSKRLEWGVRLRDGHGEQTVNYTVRLLGRRGVMQAVLVSNPRDLDKDMIAFKSALAGYDFASGERYAEFKAGDRVAEYGLAALVVGGAAAVASKSGAAKALGKMVIYGGLAALGVAGAVLKKVFGRSSA